MEKQVERKDGLTIVRDFKAPKALVFDAFATAEAFAQWWGAPGMPITVVHFDFTNGGKLHYKMEGHGQTMWGIFNYHNINRPDLLEYVYSFSDESGDICKAPFPMEFPLEIFNEMTFVESNGITTLTLVAYPINSTPEQEATYYSMISNMSQGFEGTFSQLDNYLAQAQL